MNYADVTDVTKHGSTITITLADGRQLTASATLYQLVRNHMLAVHSGKAQLVPARSAATASTAVSPDNNASAKLCGNCGCSWAYIGYQNTSSYPYLMTTGFSLDDYPGVSYSWIADVYGPNGYHYHYTSHSGLAERWSWSGQHTTQVKTSGTWEAFVDTTSYAVDTLGGLCTSIGPFDTEGL